MSDSLITQNSIIFGIGGLVIGVVLGYGSGTRGPAMEEFQQQVTSDVAAIRTMVSEDVAAVGTKIDDMAERLAAVETAVQSGADAAGGLAETLGAEIAGAAASQSSALEGGLADLRAALADLVPGGEQSSEPAAAQVVEAGAMIETASAGVGQTAVFADGALRVFVSLIDADADAVRIAVNGFDTATIAVGGALTTSLDGASCDVAVLGIDGGMAELGYTCD